MALLRLFFVWAIVFLLVSIAQTAYPQETTEHQKPNTITLTIDQAINLALQTNRNITVSRQNVESQRFSLSAARSEFELRIIPATNIGVGGGATSGSSGDFTVGSSVQRKLETGAIVSVNPMVGKASGIYTTDVGLSVQQPVLRGFGSDVNLDSVRSAEFSLQSSVRNLLQTRVNTVLETVSAFHEVVRQQETIRLYESMSGRLKGHVEVARAKENVGLTTPMDTYRAEIRLKDAEGSLTQAVQAANDAMDRVKIILSLPLATEIDVVKPETLKSNAMVGVSLQVHIANALEKRVAMKQARGELEEVERKVAVLKNRVLPELNLVFDYGRFDTSDTFSRSTSLVESRWSVRLVSTTDVFRLSEKAAYQQGLLALESLKLGYQSKKDEIDQQVRRQYNALREIEKRINIRKDQIRQAEGKLALAEVKFAHGMADNFDVIEAETELQSARINLLAAEIDYAFGVYNIRAITGTLLEEG